MTQHTLAKIGKTCLGLEKSVESLDPEGLEKLHQALHDLDIAAREKCQAKFAEHALVLADKLESGATLTARELDILHLFIVGDAASYLATENDLRQWQVEVSRRLKEIASQLDGDLDKVVTLIKIRGLCRDALNVTPDLAFYAREKRRIDRFERTMNDKLDADARRLFASIVREKVRSERL